VGISTPAFRGSASGTTTCTTGSINTTPGTTLIAQISTHHGTTALSALPTVSGGSLTWIEINNWSYIGGTNGLRQRWFYATSPVSASVITVTAACTDSDRIAVDVLEASGFQLDFSNADDAAGNAGDGTTVLPTAPASTSVIIGCACAIANPGSDFTPPTGFTELVTLTQGGNWHHEAAYKDASLSATNAWNSSNFQALVVAVELKLLPNQKGGGTMPLSIGLGGVGGIGRFGGGTQACAIGLGGLGFDASGRDDNVWRADIQLGGLGGRYFIPVKGALSFRGVADRASFDVLLGPPGSQTLLTPDIRAVTIERRLNTWPGAVEAGTADITLDDASGIWSAALAPGYPLRPAMQVAVQATFADVETNLISSYSLFIGTIDQIQIQPAPEERTVILNCRDRWKDLMNRTVQTSMLVATNVSSALTAALDAASVTQRSLDTIGDQLAFVWFNGQQLSTIIEGFVGAGGYGAYVASDGTVRIRDRYFDVGGRATVTVSYDAFQGLNLQIDDNDLVTRITASGQPRIHVSSSQVVAKLSTAQQVDPGQTVEFFLNYFDPRNNQAAPAMALVKPVVTTDYLLNAAADGSGTDLSSTASVSAAFFGDAAKITLKNNGVAAAFITKMQLRGDPVIQDSIIQVQAQDDTAIPIYGVQDATVQSDYLASEALLKRRADDVLQEFSLPRPKLQMGTVDDYPNAFKLDLASVILVTNSFTGMVNEQWTVYGVTHDIRTDDVGLVHQMTMDLQQSRQLTVFTLDSSRLDTDRIGR
jgi:hypothetical protein